MAEAATWVVLVVLGTVALRLMPAAGRLAQGALERVAALMFITAGAVGAGGWIGTATAWAVASVTAVGSSISASAAGAPVLWVVWLALSIWWLAGLLPASVIRVGIPDWLSVFGLVLPSLAASIPGAFGLAVQAALTWVSAAMISAIGAAFA